MKSLADYSVNELRSAIVDIYGGQRAETVVGDDGLVEYQWSSGLPKVQTQAGADVIARTVENSDGSGAWHSVKIDTDTWTTSANRDAEFEIDGVYHGFESNAPVFAEVLRERLSSSTASSGPTVDETAPTDGARSHRDVLTPEESGGLVSEPVDVSAVTSVGSALTDASSASSDGLSGRVLALGAALVVGAVAVIGGN